MSAFFTEMMPDNFSELLLDVAIAGTGVVVANHYRNNAIEADSLKDKLNEVMNEQKKTMSEREKDLMEKIRTRCLSENAVSYLKKVADEQTSK